MYDNRATNRLKTFNVLCRQTCEGPLQIADPRATNIIQLQLF